MTRFASRLTVALAVVFLVISFGVAEKTAASAETTPVISTEIVPEVEVQTEQLFTPADPSMTFSFGPEIFLPPTTGIRICEDVEEASCAPCGCIFIRNAVMCLC